MLNQKRKILLLIILFCVPRITLAMCGLPDVTVNTEFSNKFGLISNPRYSNLLSPTSALALEFAFAGNEFRFGTTWVRRFQCQHQLKFTGEYLSQNILFEGAPPNSTLWNEQYAFGANYSYFLCHPFLSGLETGLYTSLSRDEPFYLIDLKQHPTYYLYNAAGARAAGANAGVTLQPWWRNRVKFNLYYDDITYRTNNSTPPDRSGLGAGIAIGQIFHPRVRIDLEANCRSLYNLYSAKISWLIPVPCCTRLELSLAGQYLTGDIPQPHETRIGLALSYRWNSPYITPTYLYPTPQETILSAVTKPAVRMPQVFVTRDPGFPTDSSS